MAKYQVQSPDGSIITVEGPDGASQDEIIQQAQLLYNKPQPQQDKSVKEIVKDFGKASASLADMGINAVTGALDYGAYNLARAYYGTQMSPEQAAQKAQQESTSPKDVIGRGLGITQDPAYQNELSRQALGYVGQNMERSVVEPISQVTGAQPQDVSSMLGSAGMLVPGAVKSAAPAVKAMGQNAMDIGGGAYGAFTGKIAKPGEVPQPWQQQSVRYPVSDKFHTPENLQAWREGKISTQQLNDLAQPVSSMGPEAMKALQKTQGTIPVAGQGFRAFGEQLGETYRNPLNILTDVGLDLASGTPLPTVARLGYKGVKGYQGAQAANTLAKQGFSPQTVEEMAAIRSGAAYPGQVPQGPVTGPVAPQSTMNYPLTVQGPGQTLPPSVMPMGGPQRNVNIEGQSFTLPNQINVANSQAARPGPVAPAQTPKQISMQAAAAKIQPVAPQPTQAMPQPAPRPSTTPLPTKTTTPLVRSSSVIRKELDEIGNQSDQLHQQGLESGIKYGTPAGEAHQTQLNELLKKSKELEKELEQAKKAEKKSSKKKGPEVSQMLTEDTVFNTKSEWEKANMFNTLAGKKRVGGYREGDNIVREESFDYGNMPEDLRKHVPERSIVKRTQKGKRAE